MIKFDCKYHFDGERHERAWQCAISRLAYFGSHLEFTVQTDGSTTVIVGETSSGFFVFFKSNYTGVDLTSLFDIGRNIPELSAVCYDELKAATIAFAIKRVAHLLSPQGRKRKHHNSHEHNPFHEEEDDDDDIPF